MNTPVRCILVLGLILTLAVAAVFAGENTIPAVGFSHYHLRVLRLTGAAAPRGAGLGCDKSCGTPIVAPGAEIWGSREQQQALARALGTERADAINGYIVTPDTAGRALFDATIYPGDTAVHLVFEAVVSPGPDVPHELHLALTAVPGGAPLAEARVLAATERTVAIAAPSPLAGEWIVLAATPVDGATAQALLASERPQVLTGEIEPPRLVSRAMPEYPPQARKDHRTGKVLLQAVIDTEGVPRAISILKLPEGGEEIAAAAVEAVSKWRYEPARLKGKPVAVHFTLVINFTLE